MIKLYTVLLCLLFLAGFRVHAQPRNGYSYVNITKQTVGGTVEPGDVLEIRHSVHIAWGSNAANNWTYTNARYYDSVPSNTQLIESPTEYLRVITNEGVTIRQYSTQAGDDAGSYLPNPPSPTYYQIRINLGQGAGTPTNNSLTNRTGAGSIYVKDANSGHLPKWYSGHLFSTAFRVRVTGNYGDTIKLGAARFYSSASNSDLLGTPSGVSRMQILISANTPLCANITGTNFASESGGTFGAGNTLVRSTLPESPIVGYRYIYNNEQPAQPVDDGMYSLMNNTSPRSSTNVNAKRQITNNCGNYNDWDACDQRMFQTWDIGGDHTGTDNAAGNPPVPAGGTGGYMLVVNSDYITNEPYRQQISGLCPNTTYEFSAWIRNVCKDCHWDQNLNRSTGDGVRPNLTWVIDGIDRYSTGTIAYTGQWVKKGFTFTTGASQNSVMFSIRNNAQGGGGNDWVMDDISIATCQPNLTMRPYGDAVVCYGNQVVFDAEVKSYFNTYTQWRWEKSSDLGVTWVNETSGSGTPVMDNGQYTYTVAHPPFIGDSTTSGNIIRLRIATTPGNLNTTSCSFLASTNVVILVNNCQWVLNSNITSFKAEPINNGVSLRWATAHEIDGLDYIIEKSTNGRNWLPVTEVKALQSGLEGHYSSIDPQVPDSTTYYRIGMVYQGSIKYTHHLTLHPNVEGRPIFTIKNIQNPFSNEIQLDLAAPDKGEWTIVLYDFYGKPLKKAKGTAQKGNNHVRIENTGAWPAGSYVLVATLNDNVTIKKMIKTNAK